MSGVSCFGLTSLLDSLALFELVGLVVVRQRDGVAVFVAEDASGVADVGHRQLLVGQQGHQTRCTWWERERDSEREGERERKGEQRGRREHSQITSSVWKMNDLIVELEMKKINSGFPSSGTSCSNTSVTVWNCALSNLS